MGRLSGTRQCVIHMIAEDGHDKIYKRSDVITRVPASYQGSIGSPATLLV
jgi:hypothetical protein